MEKKEYFKQRLLRDVINHTLLPKSILKSGDTEEDKAYNDKLARDFCDVLKALTKEYQRTVYEKAKVAVSSMIGDEISSRIDAGKGKVVNVLPDELALDHIDDFREKTKDVLAKCFSKEDENEIIAKIIGFIEIEVWKGNISDTITLLENSVEMLRDELRTLIHNTVYPDKADLTKLYEEAAKITLSEKILSNNHNDVKKYADALQDYLEITCMLNANIDIKERCIYLVNNEQIYTIIAQLRTTRLHAVRLRDQLENLPEVPESKEYEKMFPMGFFEHNMPLVTPDFAFNMMLLHGFALSKGWLKENGFIDDQGNFRLFTNPNANGDSMDELLHLLDNFIEG